ELRRAADRLGDLRRDLAVGDLDVARSSEQSYRHRARGCERGGDEPAAKPRRRARGVAALGEPHALELGEHLALDALAARIALRRIDRDSLQDTCSFSTGSLAARFISSRRARQIRSFAVT